MTTIKLPIAGQLSARIPTRETEAGSDSLPLAFGAGGGFSSGTAARAANSLGWALSGALGRLEQRLEQAAGLHGEGLAQRQTALVPDFLKADLDASLGGASSAEERLASRLRDAGSPSGLDAGTYRLILGLGDSAETVRVRLEAGTTARQAMRAVADAVNAADLAVGAQVRKSASGLLAGSSALVLSADAADSGQAVSLKDASGHLAAWLDLSAARQETSFDAGATVAVTGLATAKPTRYATPGFDPGAPTTLAPGSYTLDYLITGAGGETSADSGAQSGQAVLRVVSGDTWRDVLSRMARVLGSSSPSMVARLVPAKRVANLGQGREVVDGVGLEVLSSTAKIGQRLRLSGADAASDALLSALGLSATAQPGGAARAVIDGQSRESASGLFSADSGRLTLGVGGTFGEAGLVRVVDRAGALAESLAEVLDAYNEVRGLLSSSGGLAAQGARTAWMAAADSRAAALSSVGVKNASGALWLSQEAFLAASLSRPEAVAGTLFGADGFLTQLSRLTASALDTGAESLLSARAQTGADDLSGMLPALGSSRTEAEVERANHLLDLYDFGDEGKGEGVLGGVLRRRG